MVFNVNSIKTNTLGEILRVEREIRGLSQDDIAKKVGIHKKYIAILENNDYQNFPPDVYIIGFIKRFARALNIDEKKILEIYNKEKNIQNISRSKTIKLPNITKKFSFKLDSKLLTLLIIAIIFIGSIIYIGYQIFSINTAPTINIEQPQNNITTTENSIHLKGFVKPISAELKINDNLINLNENGNFEQEIFLKPGLNVIEIISTNRFGKQTKKIITIIKE